MNFFEQQEIAHKKTWELLALFSLAVILIIMSIYIVTVVIFAGAGTQDVPGAQLSLWQPKIFFVSTLLTLMMIFCGSLYKTVSLSSGGGPVAESMGGRLVNRSTRDLDERVLLNVIDEMAIASGIPSPPVYILTGEESINAFAAGYSPDDAIVAVSEGAIQYLNRDELQGVIAHEFSHILNGDMRLNIRLIGLLHGILLLGITGYWILRSTSGSRRSRDKGRGSVLLFGLALLVIGYIGVFFAKLIKAAISRQREFLADASAVQFTRNPEGIGGALKKIGGYIKGSHIENSNAVEASHLFFSNGLKQSFLGLLATHPPLEERIKRIDPSFTGIFAKATKAKHSRADIRPLSSFSSAGEGTVSQLSGGQAKVAFQAKDALQNIGTPVAVSIEQVKQQVPLPAKLVSLTEDPFGAQTLIYGLLLDRDKQIRRKQLKHLQRTAAPLIKAELKRHLPAFLEIRTEMRLPLIELAMPELKQMSVEQYKAFCKNLKALVTADQEMDLFELMVRRMLLIHLGPEFYGKRKRPVKFRSLRPVVNECRDLLHSLADVGHDNPAEVKQALIHSLEALGSRNTDVYLKGDLPAVDLQKVDHALTKLSAASLQIKQKLLKACAACIEADGKTTVHEAEMLRVIAASLNCPMPPLRN